MAGNAEKIKQKTLNKRDSAASSSDLDEVKKHKRKCKRSRSSSANLSSSRSPSPPRKIKKKNKKCKHKSRNSSCSSASSDSDEEYKRKKRKKEKKRAKKLKKKLKKEKRDKEKVQKVMEESVSSDIPVSLMERSKAMAPMTKEEWEKRQSVIRRVYDEESGRHRLIKGDGEVIEEMVSRDRHKEINRQATMGDGNFFQSKMMTKLK